MFPQKVQRGKITFTGTREVMLNDRPERLAPGVVVRNERNTVALTGSCAATRSPSTTCAIRWAWCAKSGS